MVSEASSEQRSRQKGVQEGALAVGASLDTCREDRSSCSAMDGGSWEAGKLDLGIDGNGFAFGARLEWSVMLLQDATLEKLLPHQTQRQIIKQLHYDEK